MQDDGANYIHKIAYEYKAHEIAVLSVYACLQTVSRDNCANDGCVAYCYWRDDLSLMHVDVNVER